MGEFSVGDLDLFCERVSREDAETAFVVRIDYERGSTASVDRVELDVDSRMGVTEDVVAEAIREWRSETKREFVRSFEVYERIECRHGRSAEETREQRASGSSERGTNGNGTRGQEAPELDEPVDFSAGDRVAYYVQGPGSSVYGHVAEGRVENAPPWTKGAPGRERWFVESAVLERGGDTKEIPLEWIIGTTDDEVVAAQVDRAYEGT